jgi:hypothetical protein
VRVALLVAGGLLATILVAGVILASRGSYRAIDPPSAPPATRERCLSREPRRDRTLLERCARVEGMLLHVWRKTDDEGQPVEVHVLVLSHFRLFVVKFYPPLPERLRLGRSLWALGPLVVPRPEHLGIHELEAFASGGNAISNVPPRGR